MLTRTCTFAYQTSVSRSSVRPYTVSITYYNSSIRNSSTFLRQLVLKLLRRTSTYLLIITALLLQRTLIILSLLQRLSSRQQTLRLRSLTSISAVTQVLSRTTQEFKCVATIRTALLNSLQKRILISLLLTISVKRLRPATP